MPRCSTPLPGRQLVLTKDAMVAGVHFLPDDPPGQIAQKLLRVNLSDLAAMGAAPLGYLLALARPKEISDAWLGEFCAGLAADNATFGIAFLGGDTVSTPGPLTLVAHRDRRGADRHGAAAERRGTRRRRLGLRAPWATPRSASRSLQGELDVTEPARTFLIERYRLPQPRLALGQALRGIASAAIDVSDGLVADLGHILETSAVGAELHAGAAAAFGRGPRPARRPRRRALRRRRLRAAVHRAARSVGPRSQPSARRLDLPLTRIGTIRADQGLHVLDEKGQELPVRKAGWQHF